MEKITVKIVIDKSADSDLYRYLVNKPSRRRATFLRELATQGLLSEKTFANSSHTEKKPEDNNVVDKPENIRAESLSVNLPSAAERDEVRKENVKQNNELKKGKGSQLLFGIAGGGL
ncbi:MAG: hypothetical protein Q8K07_12265 [Methylicorpusculum sp.]|jgi:hypothetical protein|uniref:hypothetical protein n=1 Tax=Methylicorpusculum TaxID=2713642 RepID=UPI00135AA53A|nr:MULTISPECIES: hypothetical protein [Methylicorpusculum]MBS3951884.1 hypothetical protein [Methylomicrobium sp.]MCD2451971.1 hypothetical protein [Methylicorpusculum oleiharenae]MDP2202788.1 hypothetical protein [Methylicorpusculum sp.]